MKILESELKQGSPEWLEWRKGGLGGSDIGTVADINPYKTSYRLWQELTGIIKAEDISNLFHVKRGTQLEPLARQMANSEMNRNFEPCIHVSDEYEYLRYSCDGDEDGFDDLLEIKCMGDKNHEKILNWEPSITLHIEEWKKHPLNYYMPQMQYGMYLAKKKRCHFIAYNPSHPKPYKRLTFLADPKQQNELIAKAKVFWALVKTKTPPDLSDADFEVVENTLVDEFVKKYKDLAEAKSKLEEQMETFKHELKMLTGNKNIKTTGGAKIFQSWRKGSVDYSAIPQLQSVDLEPYRKGPVAVFNIKS